MRKLVNYHRKWTQFQHQGSTKFYGDAQRTTQSPATTHRAHHQHFPVTDGGSHHAGDGDRHFPVTDGNTQRDHQRQHFPATHGGSQHGDHGAHHRFPVTQNVVYPHFPVTRDSKHVDEVAHQHIDVTHGIRQHTANVMSQHFSVTASTSATTPTVRNISAKVPYFPYGNNATLPLPLAPFTTPSSATFFNTTIEPLLITFLFYFYCFMLCELARRITEHCIKDLELRWMLIELLGTLQICVMLLEGKHIILTYGTEVYTISLFMLVFLHCLTIRTAYGNPCFLLYLYRNNFIGSMCAVALAASQVAAAFLTFHVAKVFWHFGLRRDHEKNFIFYHCSTGIHVHALVGMVCEATATGINRLITLKALEVIPKYWFVASAATWAILVRVGLHVTGCYQNPILATALTLGCNGDKPLTHAIVYWCGPMMGFQLASYIYFYKWTCPTMLWEYVKSLFSISNFNCNPANLFPEVSFVCKLCRRKHTRSHGSEQELELLEGQRNEEDRETPSSGEDEIFEPKPAENLFSPGLFSPKGRYQKVTLK